MLTRNIFKSLTSLTTKAPLAQFSKEIQIDSVEGHKPPSYEESVQGKYAGVLFSVASQQKELYNVLQDMKFFAALNEGAQFREFVARQTVPQAQQKDIINSLGTYNTLTQNFLNTLIENKRVNSLGKIAEKYVEYYKILNKEENIVITSAKELNADQKAKVQTALKQGRGENFTLTYVVDPSIQGGLTMTSGMEFLDCSLATRLGRLRSELDKLTL